MPRRKIEYSPGAIYHIYNRGAGRQSIFYEDENYRYLLSLIKDSLAELQVTLLAYCLLPNHYHWLVRQDGEDAGRTAAATGLQSVHESLQQALRAHRHAV